MDPGLRKLITLPPAIGLREICAWLGQENMVGERTLLLATGHKDCRPLEPASPALCPRTASCGAGAVRVQIQNRELCCHWEVVLDLGRQLRSAQGAPGVFHSPKSYKLPQCRAQAHAHVLVQSHRPWPSPGEQTTTVGFSEAWLTVCRSGG